MIVQSPESSGLFTFSGRSPRVANGQSQAHEVRSLRFRPADSADTDDFAGCGVKGQLLRRNLSSAQGAALLGLGFTGRSGLGAGPAESVSSEKLRKEDSQTDHKQDTGDYDDVGLNRQGKHLALLRNMSIRIGFGTKRQFPLFVLKG
ncbi:hypothetical protein ET33_00435 [Paenibacillus tyrfis]|uniref:Uncharacterized protein n=1 Tax=Paenibacillus tyrfis TaxID=1501230 RepID=A0A081PB48_9BACL|nr:hypothetical protein ET33_00435 [Paenibacillus tyrfis]